MLKTAPIREESMTDNITDLTDYKLKKTGMYLASDLGLAHKCGSTKYHLMVSGEVYCAKCGEKTLIEWEPNFG